MQILSIILWLLVSFSIALISYYYLIPKLRMWKAKRKLKKSLLNNLTSVLKSMEERGEKGEAVEELRKLIKMSKKI